MDRAIRVERPYPQNNTSGLLHAQRVLNGVPGIGFVTLTKKDIVRHKLVTRIVEAYEKHEKQAAAEKNNRQ